MKLFTWEELMGMNLQKDELAKEVGIDCAFDTALPQTWLDNFVRISGLNYDKVRYSTFTTYPKNGGCVIVTAWDKANKWL